MWFRRRARRVPLSCSPEKDWLRRAVALLLSLVRFCLRFCLCFCFFAPLAAGSSDGNCPIRGSLHTRGGKACNLGDCERVQYKPAKRR